MPDPPRDSDAIQYVRICEQHKTRRHALTMLTIVILGVVLAIAAVKIADKPWWEVLIGGVVTALVAPSGLFAFMQKRIKAYTISCQKRVSDLEKLSDPQRTSSELLPDGTNPPEDYA